jgi:hypothetical protein
VNRLWLALALLGCAHPTRRVADPPASQCADVLSDMEKMHPDQIAPEPTEPTDECLYTRLVVCRPPSPTTAAWQMAPFSGCPRTIVTPDGGSGAFSRLETRKARHATGCVQTPGDGDCCYVEFKTGPCR